MKVVIRRDGDILEVYEDSLIIKISGSSGIASGSIKNYLHIYTVAERTADKKTAYDIYEVATDDLQVVMQGYIDAVKNNDALYEVFVIPIA